MAMSVPMLAAHAPAELLVYDCTCDTQRLSMIMLTLQNDVVSPAVDAAFGFILTC